MAVIIRKMDLPPNCKECDLSNCLEDITGDPRLYCDLLGQVDDFPDKRDSDCPLEEVKESYMKNISKTGFLCSECGFGDFDGFHGYEPKYCPNCGLERRTDDN